MGSDSDVVVTFKLAIDEEFSNVFYSTGVCCVMDTILVRNIQFCLRR